MIRSTALGVALVALLAVAGDIRAGRPPDAGAQVTAVGGGEEVRTAMHASDGRIHDRDGDLSSRLERYQRDPRRPRVEVVEHPGADLQRGDEAPSSPDAFVIVVDY